MDSNNRTYLFEQLPVPQAVFKQVFPAVISQMIALVYSLADTYFVGMLNHPQQTAAITVVYPSFVMLTAVSNLFGVGGASLIAQKLGKQKPQDAKEISAISFWPGLICALLFSLIFLLLAPKILSLCGATAETYPYAYGYARWAVILGGPFVIGNTLLANLIRAEGRGAEASFGVSLGGILNIALDPIFILPRFLGMGVVGAGVATALSNFVSVAYFLLYLRQQKEGAILQIRPAYLRHTAIYLKSILAIGFPSALQYGLTVVAVAAQANFVAKYPTEAVAALGIVKKLDQLPLYFSIGVSGGLLPLLAYYYGAGNHVRRKQVFRLGCDISFGFAMLCLLAYEGFAPQLSALFIADAQTIAYSSSFLRRMVTAMPFMAICYPMIIQFQAMGQVREALIVSILRKGILDVPLLFLLDGLMPLYGCMWVQPTVDCISLIAAISLYRRLKLLPQQP